MKVCLLCANLEVAKALERYIGFIFGKESIECYTQLLGKGHTVSRDLLDVDLWICEVFSADDAENPEGWRTAKKLPDKIRRLILFLSFLPETFPKEGFFWCTLPYCLPKISSKIKNILSLSPQKHEDFEKLEKSWPLLKKEAKNHHHGEQ